MNIGKMYKAGQIVLANVQFVNIPQSKIRPALVLFTEKSNIIVAAITSNTNMKGIRLGKLEGLQKDSTVKTNYIFTFSSNKIIKPLLSIPYRKKLEVREDLVKNINQLITSS